MNITSNMPDDNSVNVYATTDSLQPQYDQKSPMNVLLSEVGKITNKKISSSFLLIYLESKLNKILRNEILKLVNISEDRYFSTSPDLPVWAWTTLSVVFGFTSCFGILSNLVIVYVYVKNSTVRFQNQ